MNRKKFIYTSLLCTTAALFSNKLSSKPLFSEEYLSHKGSHPSSPAPSTDYDAIIVGTGYGGAVAALRLTEAGKKVLMLEMELDWEKSKRKFSKMAWATKESTWLRNRTIAPFGNFRLLSKFTGVLDRIDFENIKVYAGRGVGGGSLANGGMAVTPKKSYFKEIFPQLDTELFYKKYFPLANKELGTEMMPDTFYKNSEYYQFSRVGETEAHKAGFKTFRVPNVYDFTYMKKEEEEKVPKSALGGEVIYGNNHGKKDVTKTYLKKAKASGNLDILDLHQVSSITELNQGKYQLNVRVIDTKGRTTEKKIFETTHLFLAAGSLGTTEILLRSKAKGHLPRIDNQIGKYWGNNGNCMSGRNFIKAGTGSKQSTIPAAGVDNWDDKEHCFFTEIAPLPIGIETYAGLYLSINRVLKYGEIIYDLQNHL